MSMLEWALYIGAAMMAGFAFSLSRLLRKARKRIRKLEDRLKFAGKPVQVLVMAYNFEDYKFWVGQQFTRGKDILMFRPAIDTMSMLGWHGPVVMTERFITDGSSRGVDVHEAMMTHKLIIETSYYGMGA